MVYRQEVLWDDVRAEGATLADGGFESRRGEPAAGWQSGGGAVIEQSSRRAGRRGNALRPDLAQPDALHHVRRHRRPAGDDPAPCPGGPTRRPARDEADRRPIDPGSPGGPAVPPRSQPRQRPGSTPWPGLGRPLHARGPSHSSAPRGSTTSGSRSAGTTTPAPARSSASGPRSSPGSTSWSTPGCVRAWA